MSVQHACRYAGGQSLSFGVFQLSRSAREAYSAAWSIEHMGRFGCCGVNAFASDCNRCMLGPPHHHFHSGFSVRAPCLAHVGRVDQEGDWLLCPHRIIDFALLALGGENSAWRAGGLSFLETRCLSNRRILWWECWAGTPTGFSAPTLTTEGRYERPTGGQFLARPSISTSFGC